MPDGVSACKDYEVVTAGFNAGVPAATLDGGTGFSGEAFNFAGIQLVDYDEVVDRNENLVLLEVQHRLSVYANSTETEDGTVVAAVEVSADPALSDVTETAAEQDTDSIDDGDVTGDASMDDSIDNVGRPLVAMAGAPFSDTSTGVGGAGTEGSDRYDSTVWPAEFGEFHPRDELFLNGRLVAWNIDDAGIHIAGSIQHVYGVVEC